jgi:hypothetical protein
MLSQYSTKVKIRVGLGILPLIAAIVPTVLYPPLRWLGLIPIVAGTALAAWGLCCHAREKRFELPAWARWLLVLPAAAAVFVSVFILTSCIVALGEELVRTLRGTDPPYLYAWDAILVITSTAGSYGLVLAGARTAPRHRSLTAALLVLGSVWLCRHLGIAFTMALFGASSPDWWWHGSWILALISGVAASVQVHRFANSQIRAQEFEMVGK